MLPERKENDVIATRIVCGIRSAPFWVPGSVQSFSDALCIPSYEVTRVTEARAFHTPLLNTTHVYILRIPAFHYSLNVLYVRSFDPITVLSVPCSCESLWCSWPSPVSIGIYFEDNCILRNPLFLMVIAKTVSDRFQWSRRFSILGSKTTLRCSSA
jgi:hypothetical protein